VNRATWLDYAAGWRTFGGAKVLLIILGALLGVTMEDRTTSEGLEWLTPQALFTTTTLLQLASAFLLGLLRRDLARGILGWYYAVAGFVGVGSLMAAGPRSSIGSFLAASMAVGAAALVLTALYILENWPRIEYAQADASVFLGSVHVLVLVASASTAANYLAPEDTLSDWQDALIQTTQLSLTVLALPLVAGVWVRLATGPVSLFPNRERNLRPVAAAPAHVRPYSPGVEEVARATPEHAVPPVAPAIPTRATASAAGVTWVSALSALTAAVVLALVLSHQRERS